MLDVLNKVTLAGGEANVSTFKMHSVYPKSNLRDFKRRILAPTLWDLYSFLFVCSDGGDTSILSCSVSLSTVSAPYVSGLAYSIDLLQDFASARSSWD